MGKHRRGIMISEFQISQTPDRFFISAIHGKPFITVILEKSQFLNWSDTSVSRIDQIPRLALFIEAFQGFPNIELVRHSYIIQWLTIVQLIKFDFYPNLVYNAVYKFSLILFQITFRRI